MIDIVLSFGYSAYADGAFGRLTVEYVHTIYENYISITEYESVEEIHYNLEKYKMDKIKEICASYEDPHIQVEKIKTILITNLYAKLWD